MRLAKAALAVALPLGLAACGSGASCSSLQEASSYQMKWMDDLSAALSSGKLKPADGDTAHRRMIDAVSGHAGDPQATCDELADIRSDIEF
jgi:hypothetical protein